MAYRNLKFLGEQYHKRK